MTEKEAIKKLKDLARDWPKTLWLFAASGDLCVMSTDSDGNRVYTEQGGGVDPRYIIEYIDIPCDGGDW